jgi:DNA-binding transcriptional ArsR family regulator
VATASAKRAGQRGKTIEQNVEYAVSHFIRSQILVLLHQGPYATGEIAETIREPLNIVGHHLQQLLDAGSIELAGYKRRRNTRRHYYRAVNIPFLSKAKAKTWTWQERQVTAGLVVQSLVAEMMAGLWGGKLFDDPRDWLTWERLDLDAKGRQELYEEQRESWERLQAIKARAANRVGESAEETAPYFASVLGFEGALKAPPSSYSARTD